MRRHPLAGMAAAFAGVSGGYSANLLIGTVDPLLSGITQEAAQYIDPEYLVHPAVNWYFMAASTVLVTLIGTWVTHRYVEPNLGKYNDKHSEAGGVSGEEYLKPLTKREKKAFLYAGIATAVVALIAALTILPGKRNSSKSRDRQYIPFAFYERSCGLFVYFLSGSGDGLWSRRWEV